MLYTAKYVNFRVLCFQGQIVAQTRCGGENETDDRVIILYYSDNTCIFKNYCNRTTLVQIIAEDVVAYVFLKHGVYTKPRDFISERFHAVTWNNDNTSPIMIILVLQTSSSGVPRLPAKTHRV